jgi:hypothetical protein
MRPMYGWMPSRVSSPVSIEIAGRDVVRGKSLDGDQLADVVGDEVAVAFDDRPDERRRR